MQIKTISIKADFESIVDIENAWCDVLITSDDDRTYIVQVMTYKNFLESEDENTLNFLAPTAPSIIVKEFTKETIESAIHYYAREENGYWLKFYHMGTEIDDKTLDVLTDRWFAKNSLIDFTVTNESNLLVDTESLSTLKAKLKFELKEDLLIELGKESKIENFSKILLGIASILLASQILAIFS